MRKLMLLLKSLLLLPIHVFSKISVFTIIEKSTIHSTSAVCHGCRIYFSSIAKYSFVGFNSKITHAKIGSFCSIAENVIINPGDHPLNLLSTSPVFYSERNILKKCFNQTDIEEFNKTVIGNDVLIGTHAFIKGGITIGHGSVIGAYTIVTKDVEPYSIVVGNPGKTIRKRFDDITISKLLKSKWWEYDDDTLYNKSVNISDIDKFLE
jgi:acetyltransferase-like isoleucine patch superfamily enzyme